MKRDRWVEALRSAGFECEVLPGADGGAVVVLKRGARVLGIFPDTEAENALWVHPDLAEVGEDPERAKKRYMAEGDWNTGGERTWLSPEIEFFVEDANRFWDTYRVPKALDPGDYTMVEPNAGWETELSHVVRLRAYRAGEDIAMKLRKRVRLVSNPLAAVRDSTALGVAPGDYSFIGCETDLHLEPVNGANGHSIHFNANVSLWSIMMLPAKGEVWIPTYGTGEAADFFEPTSSSHLTVMNGMIRFRIDGQERHKISVKAPWLTGRIGYSRQESENRAVLLVRSFMVDPSADYRDVSAANLEERGHCVQCYNDDGTIGAFGEMEYHTPILDRKRGECALTDRSQIWCYAGAPATVERIRQTLIGM
jgi:hypothetical protein